MLDITPSTLAKRVTIDGRYGLWEQQSTFGQQWHFMIVGIYERVAFYWGGSSLFRDESTEAFQLCLIVCHGYKNRGQSASTLSFPEQTSRMYILYLDCADPAIAYVDGEMLHL